MGAPSKAERVLAWLEAGISTEAGQAFVTDDVVFAGPPSSQSASSALRWNGRDSLRRVTIADRALYKNFGAPGSRIDHFIVEEADQVLLQFEVRYTTWTGAAYRNDYVMAVRFAGDKIASAAVLMDTAHFQQVLYPTPEARAGVAQRIADGRREAGAPLDVF